ncbi:MAG: class I SAM-dependent methyltransferase [Bdellovibrionales bacterium]|nr:class I SAM-dependent methyltransferase [Bdellovibrionales bacterium]
MASVYDKHYSSESAIAYRNCIFDAFLSDIDLQNQKMLDAMCGGGESSGYFIAKKNVQVFGIDISEKQCEFFKSRYPSVSVACGSILDTPFDDNTFDFIITESLHHLHPYVNGGVNEITRILKPGGYFMVWEPNSGSFFDMVRKIWYSVDRKFFEKNEASIDFQKLVKDHSHHLELVKKQFGGNVAHLFVMNSMLFRIPVAFVKIYGPFFIFIELLLNRIQFNFVSCWVLGLFRKSQ